MNVLVTGGSGFIGRAVVQELNRAGHVPTVLAHRRSVNALPIGTTVRWGDLTAPETARRLVDSGSFDGVCHLAGLTGVRDSFDRPSTYFDVNTGGTEKLMRALLDRYRKTGKSIRFVLASTRAVYARTTDPSLTEQHLVGPESPYGSSKRAAEELLESEYRVGALEAVSLRCFNVSGGFPGCVDTDTNRLIPRMIGALTGELPPVRLGPLSHRRDFVHVLDVARAFVSALSISSPRRFTVYNVGTGVPTSMAQVVELVERASGRALPLAAPPLDSGTDSDSDSSAADTSRIRADLGWRPHFDTSETVGDAWRFA